MMNRRWFFSATGTAFLTAACAVVRQPRSGTGSALERPAAEPKTPDEHFDLLIQSFFVGLNDQIDPMLRNATLSDDQLPRDPKAREARLRPHLETIYRPRFDYRISMDDLLPGDLTLRMHQACVLGQLTGLAFAYESGALNDPRPFSFEKPDAIPRLQSKHIDWARDSYGLYTGSRTPKRTFEGASRKRPFDLCGEPDGPGGRGQIDQTCPFCFA
jgi:hypothetical protein